MSLTTVTKSGTGGARIETQVCLTLVSTMPNVFIRLFQDHLWVRGMLVLQEFAVLEGGGRDGGSTASNTTQPLQVYMCC